MAYWFRHGDPAYPPLWEHTGQPEGRWHTTGDGPVQYLADTPTGAWAEFLRHEGITDPDDLADVTRILWAIDVPDRVATAASRAHVELQLDPDIAVGGLDSYPVCQREAARLRDLGIEGFMVVSAALQPGCAAGWRTDGGRVPADAADGIVLVLFGTRPDLVSWWTGGPIPADPTLLERVVPLTD